LDRVNHRHKAIVIGRRTRNPVSGQVNEHIDVITEQVENRLPEGK
jgi:hypothetical protein